MSTSVISSFVDAAGRLRVLKGRILLSRMAYAARLRPDSTRLAFPGRDQMSWTLEFADAKSLNHKQQRKLNHSVPAGFISCILSGALSGAAIGACTDTYLLGMVFGVVGAVADMFDGTNARAKLLEVLGGGLPLWLRWKTWLQSAVEMSLRNGLFGCS
jgi:uncharacterized membrane protein